MKDKNSICWLDGNECPYLASTEPSCLRLYGKGCMKCKRLENRAVSLLRLLLETESGKHETMRIIMRTRMFQGLLNEGKSEEKCWAMTERMLDLEIETWDPDLYAPVETIPWWGLPLAKIHCWLLCHWPWQVRMRVKRKL